LTFFLLEAIQILDSSQPAEKLLRAALTCVKNNASKSKKRKQNYQNFEVVYDTNEDNSNSNDEDNKANLIPF